MVTYPLLFPKKNLYDFLIFVTKKFASNNFVLKLKQSAYVRFVDVPFLNMDEIIAIKTYQSKL